ncbi:hypothetical protein [uncultured Lacinutrix sp.]|uniref:hypothetical protein n=1 Tax=uncultured Lacinutrix sp. TaxID=574032 RepID=UPI00261331C6|nr:hypothetical protein [uncultured Lacinutrix sp.]
MKKTTPLSIVLIVILFLFSLNLSFAQCGSGQTYNTFCHSQNDSNVVGFEFCPSTGEIAQSTIISGTIGSAFAGIPTTLTNLTVYEGASGSGTSGTIVFGPVNGDISGNTITATQPDLCLIFVFNNTPGIFGCAEGFDTTTEVCSESISATTVSFTAPNDLCVNAGIQTNLSGGSPSGGVYSGPGVTDNGNGSTYSFDPNTASTGTITITYTNGGAASDTVDVIAVPTINFTAPADLCIDAGTVALNNATPSGGTYSGPGITNTGANYFFNPAFAGVGVHSITYTEPGVCGATGTDTIEVLEACGCPSEESSFFFCGGENVETNLVVFEVCPSSGMAAQATINSGTFNNNFGNSLTVYEGDSGSGTSGTIVFGPASGDLTNTVISSLGANKCLIFVSNSLSGVGCQDSAETALSVCGINIAPSISFSALNDLCIDEGEQSGLSGGFPVGGVYSGNGVTDDGNGITYTFNPNIAGAGITTITYTESGNSVTDDVEVFDLGTAGCLKFTAPADLCIDAGVQNTLGGATPTGGIYSGNGVTDDGNGLTYSFDPATAGTGTTTITYTLGMISTNDIIEVFALPAVTFSVDFADLCTNGGIQLSSLAGSPSGAGGVFSGPGVTNVGGGINYLFDPSVAGAGIHTVTYTYTDANGCSNSASDTVEVFALPDVTLTLPADLCAGGNGGLPVGGTYSGPGVTDDGNGTTFSFNPNVAGAGAHTITYSFTESVNGCTGEATAIYEDTEAPIANCVAPFIVQLDAMGSASITVGDILDNATDNCGVASSSIDITNFDCSNVGENTVTLTVTDISGNEGTCVTVVTVEDPTGNCPLRVSPKVYLQGAALNSTIATDGLMRDDLRASGDIPTTSPYIDMLTINASVLNTTGVDAIVDWVWVELRDANSNTTVVDSKSALLQRDGNIVEIDGTSPLVFNQAQGSYYIVIKHRNHLGIMTDTSVALSGAISTIDFTDANNQITFGTDAETTFGMPSGVVAMWSGDANGDGQLNYSGALSDIPGIRSQVFNDPNNSVFGGPPVASYQSSGYNTTDIDMDGLTVYSGGASDVLHIRNNTFNNPSNSVFGGPPTGTYVFIQQLPEGGN